MSRTCDSSLDSILEGIWESEKNWNLCAAHENFICLLIKNRSAWECNTSPRWNPVWQKNHFVKNLALHALCENALFLADVSLNFCEYVLNSTKICYVLQKLALPLNLSLPILKLIFLPIIFSGVILLFRDKQGWRHSSSTVLISIIQSYCDYQPGIYLTDCLFDSFNWFGSGPLIQIWYIFHWISTKWQVKM